MPKSLVITEKPSVARDIVAALGGFQSHDDEYFENDQFICTFAVGHLLELLEPEEIDAVYKRWTLDTLPILPAEFKLKPKQGQSDRIRIIKKLIQRPDVETIVNACDAGREGELIFREVIKFVGTDKPIRRLWLQSMTADAIRRGFGSLEDGKKYETLGSAAECRSLSDWLIGMNASRALTIRLRSRANKGAWSAGRVQTPTLALLVDREIEILAHRPEPYWRVVATFDAPTHRYEATWTDPKFVSDEKKPQFKADRLFDQKRAEAIVAAAQGQPAQASETRKPSRETAPPLFDLTSLQREANRRFGWSAARTLQAAQRCYEQHKILTYPRTDSRCLPEDYRPEVDKVLQAFTSDKAMAPHAKYLIKNGRQNEGRVFNNAAVRDHFAIIPTGQSRSLSGDDIKLYDLVARRFLSAFFPPAVWEQVERTTVVANETFQSRARSLREPGWRSVLEQDSADSSNLPPLVANQDKSDDVVVKTASIETQEEVTKPPAPITEARLLSLMENAGKQIEDEELAAVLHEKGLGTPATRADIIENLKSRDYIDRGLRPTVKGMRLIDLLHRIRASRITSAELTGELELHLNEVEKGERKPEQFMSEIVDYTKELVEATRSFDYDKIYPNVDPLGICPCGKNKPVYERAWFYRCEEAADEAEDCTFRIWKDKNGRYIDRETVRTLLKDGQTGELDGFRDRRGRTYKGALKIDQMQLVLVPIAGSESGGGGDEPVFEVNPEPLGPDPLHPEAMVVETPTHFISTERQRQVLAGERKPTGLVIPRLVCKREITRAEAIAYLNAKETDFINDFISRFGRPFTAKLKMKEDGRHSFEFQPRAEGAGKGRRGRWGKKKGQAEEETSNEETPAAKTTKKQPKATKKKTKTVKVKKKASKKKTSPDE
ncbi:DNA topoisomerase 3 [bacterium]|nr:DNA topoisomerase 3 [bacterium]